MLSTFTWGHPQMILFTSSQKDNSSSTIENLLSFYAIYTSLPGIIYIHSPETYWDVKVLSFRNCRWKTPWNRNNQCGRVESIILVGITLARPGSHTYGGRLLYLSLCIWVEWVSIFGAIRLILTSINTTRCHSKTQNN